jgi:EAL domain-containing protein (putative c-di-GMP-specific phosphodiesterase class I)/GGDEF domain-containing protein
MVTVNRLFVCYIGVIATSMVGRLWWPIGAWLLLGLATALVLATPPLLFREEDAPAWTAMAMSAVVFTAADLIYAPRPEPAVHLADVLYTPAYILNAVALRRLTRHVGGARGFWDASVVAVGLVVVVVPVLVSQAPRADPATLALLYPLADLVILALSVQLARAYPTASSWLLIAASLWLLASGFLPAWIGYPAGAWLLLTLRTGFLSCWGLAALFPLPRQPTSVDERYRGAPVWLFVTVVLLAPAALLIQAVIDSDTREAVLAVACAVAGLYVVFRLGSAARATASDPVTGLIVLPVLMLEARVILASGRAVTLFLVEMREFHPATETGARRGSDELLRSIAQRLVDAAGDGLVARASLEQFAVLAELPAAEAAVDKLAGELAAAVDQPLTVHGKRLHVGSSLGHATADVPADADDLLGNAEVALHAARNDRPGARIAYHPRQRAAELERATLTADLREAIDADQLLLEYQPIVGLADGLISGFEALVRWQHPRLGRLGPDRFVPLAESAGLIGDMGAWILTRAVAGTASLNILAGRPVYVDINVSAEQFGTRMAQDLRHALAMNSVDPALLVLEITETVLVPDRQWLAGEMADLKATGVRMALDDFGTGYSSLARLKNLPIDIIKIDKMFVTGLKPGRQAQMVSGILQIAESLGLLVVAEGIEETSERDVLVDLGCDFGQGYLYSRPVGLDQAQAMIQAGPLIR